MRDNTQTQIKSSPEQINHLRQLLCLPDTPTNRSTVCAACMDDMMWDMAEATIPGLKAWADRQFKIAEALALHATRDQVYEIADREDPYDDFSSHALRRLMKESIKRKEEYEKRLFSIKELSGADLRGYCLSWSNLRKANLSKADLSGADILHANLCDSDLTDTNLSDADLRSADLKRADLRRANLCGACLDYASLIGARFDGAKYSKSTVFPEGVQVHLLGMAEVTE